MEVSFRTVAADWRDTAAHLDRLSADAFPVPVESALIARSDSFRFVDRTDLPDRSITSLAVVSPGLVRPVTDVLVASRDLIGVSVHRDAAEHLGLRLGDKVVLERRSERVEVEVVALVEPVDRGDRRWWSAPLVRDGVVADGSFDDLGPFLVEADVLGALPGSVKVTWRLFPVPDGVGADDLSAVADAVESLRAAVDDIVRPADLSVSSDLPATIEQLRTTGTTSGAIVGSVLLQLVALALVGVASAASVLAAGRTVEAEVLRSRGAGAGARAVLAVAEGLLVAAPAVLAGPALAVPVTSKLGDWGPVAAAGLDLRPSLPLVAWVLAGVVGLVVVGLVAWPSARSANRTARDPAGADRGLARPTIEVVLAVLALLGLARLSTSGFSSADFEGRLGADPVLVLVPAAAVVAVTVVAVRLVQVVASLADRLLGSAGSVPMSLAASETARDRSATSRTVALVALAAAIATAAAIHSESWERSVVDRSDAASSVDAQVIMDERPDLVARSAFIGAALAGVDGVGPVFPVDRTTVSIVGGGSVPIVLTDTVTLARTARLRPDLLDDDGRARLGDLHRPVDLGGVLIVPDAPAGGGGAGASGEAPDDAVEVRYELGVAGAPPSGVVRVRVVLVDGDGTVVPVDLEPLPFSSLGTEGHMTIPLAAVVGGSTVSLRAPVELVSIDLDVPAVQDRRRPSEPDVDIDTTRFSLTLGPIRTGDSILPLRADWAIGRLALTGSTVPPSVGLSPTDDGLRVTLDSGASTNAAASVSLSLDTSPIGDGMGDGVPVLATPALLRGSSLAVGDRIAVRVDGVATDLVVVGTLPAVPFATDERAALIADRATAVADRLDRERRFVAPRGWAMAMRPEALEDLGALVADAGIGRVVDRRSEAASLARDPVLIGLSGGWGLAIVAAPTIAFFGLVVSAAGTIRDRRDWVAVARSLGVRSIELLRWRLAVAVPVVIVATLLGGFGGWFVVDRTLSASIVAADGSNPVPAAVVEVPWTVLLAVHGSMAAVGAASAVVVADRLRRRRPADDLRSGSA